ncbi:MAG: sel1 repeat family protein [Rhodospirillales bacterium]|nr:sel1 repeat family protein [Rhodospirillales bacterium]
MFRFFIGSLFSLLLAFPAAADYSAGATAYGNRDYEKARQEYLASAEVGDPRSQFGLAVMYHTGKGVAKDYAKAREWYDKAATQGYAKAQNNLGIMYRRGHGVERNPREAFTWIWMAAMQGYARAEKNLAEMYMQGEGVAKDLPLAYAWLEFAMTDLPGKIRAKAENRRNKIVAELSDSEVKRAKRMAKALRDARG